MSKEEAIKTLIAFTICNHEEGRLTCGNGCPFHGDLVEVNGRYKLHCAVNNLLTDDKINEAVKLLLEEVNV